MGCVPTVGESTFKTDMPSNVVYPLGLLKYIKAHQKIILTSQDVQRIVESIETASLSKSFKTNREHVQNLKADRDKVVSKKTHNSEICPKCGNDLVIRTAKKGQNIGNQFYGCKSYPKCRYTRNIKEQSHVEIFNSTDAIFAFSRYRYSHKSSRWRYTLF